MNREMRLISKITEKDLIKSLGFYASAVIRYSTSITDFLRKINWDQGIRNSKDANNRVIELFGESYEKAKQLYSDSFLGNIKIDDYY